MSDNLDDHGGVSPAETARQGARQLLTSAGFDVHKEEYACDVDLIGGQFNGRWLLPRQRKVWSMVTLSRVVRLSGLKVPSSLVETTVATLAWYFLLERSSLSVFDTVYKFCRENRGKKPLRLPTSVLRELAAAEAVVPPLGIDLGATWHPPAYMFDASLRGSAVGCTTAATDELRAEAKWSTRGGWAVWLGESEDEIATNNAVLTFGQRFRAPPAGGILPQGGESPIAGAGSTASTSTSWRCAVGSAPLDTLPVHRLPGVDESYSSRTPWLH